MAEANDISSRFTNLNLGTSKGDTERSEKFWNSATLEMKLSVEKDWLDAVWNCKRKPNFGMRDLDPIFEERCSNKLELTGPLIDGYLNESGRASLLNWGCPEILV